MNFYSIASLLAASVLCATLSPSSTPTQAGPDGCPTPATARSDAARASVNAVASLGGLEIICPDDAKLFCGDSTDPSNTGFPTVIGACDNNPVVTYHDNTVTTSCAADRFDFIIMRTWMATDSCGGSASCVQKIDVLKRILFLDIHPTSCPNPVKITGNGVIPAAILGTANFDVTEIDPSSIQLWGPHCDGGPVLPIQHDLEDVATPYTGGLDCGCNTLGADGYVDLALKFNKQQVVSALHLSTYPHDSFVHITVIGSLTNGCQFIGQDCIRVQ
jgi:hypothetical protein